MTIAVSRAESASNSASHTVPKRAPSFTFITSFLRRSVSLQCISPPPVFWLCISILTYTYMKQRRKRELSAVLFPEPDKTYRIYRFSRQDSAPQHNPKRTNYCIRSTAGVASMGFTNQNCIKRRLHLMNTGLYSKRFGETGPAALAGTFLFPTRDSTRFFCCSHRRFSFRRQRAGHTGKPSDLSRLSSEKAAEKAAEHAAFFRYTPHRVTPSLLPLHSCRQRVRR